MCFGIASLFAPHEGLKLNRTLYYRDAVIYLFTLTILTFFLKDNKIEPYEAFILIMLCPFYLYISTHNSAKEEKSGIILDKTISTADLKEMSSFLEQSRLK